MWQNPPSQSNPTINAASRVAAAASPPPSLRSGLDPLALRAVQHGRADRLPRSERQPFRRLGGALRRHGAGRRTPGRSRRCRLRLHPFGSDLDTTGRADRPDGRGATNSVMPWPSPATRPWSAPTARWRRRGGRRCRLRLHPLGDELDPQAEMTPPTRPSATTSAVRWRSPATRRWSAPAEPSAARPRGAAYVFTRRGRSGRHRPS